MTNSEDKLKYEQALKILNNISAKDVEEIVNQGIIDFENNLKVQKISSPIAKFFFSVNKSIFYLNHKLEELNKDKHPHEQGANYPEAIESLIHDKLVGSEDFFERGFVNRYKAEAKNRVEEKLRYLNNPDLILGFEYVLDEMLEEQHYNIKMAEQDEVELSDIFSPEEIANIENKLDK